MKHVRNVPDLSSFDLDISREAKKKVAEVIHETISDDVQSWADLPVLKRGKWASTEDDALMIYFHIGLCDPDVGPRPVYAASITEVINEHLESFPEDGHGRSELERLSVALRAMADKIDATITPPPTHQKTHK